MTRGMTPDEFDRWFRSVAEQDEQLRRLRGEETVTERIERLRAGLNDYRYDPGPAYKYRAGPGPIQAEQVRRLAEQMRARERQTETRRGPQARTWHDWRSPGLRRDCTRLDGHEGGCRRVAESVENRPYPSSPDVPRYVIVVEAKVGAL